MAEKKKDEYSQSGRLVTIGLEVGVGAVLGFGVGTWLDRKYGWGSKGVLICTLLGIAAGMYHLVKEGIRVNKD